MDNEEDHETHTVGKTAEEFNTLVQKYITGSVKAGVLPVMKEMFAEIIPEKAEAIDECYAQGELYMAKNLKRGVRQIIEDNNLVDKQNKLDQMLADAEKRDRVKTHLLPTPNQVSTGIVYRSKKMEAIRLQKMLDDIAEENYEMMNAIKKGIKEKREKESRMNAEIELFTKSIASASSIPMDDLIDVMDKLDMKETL